MKKSEIKDLMKQAIEPHKICRAYLKYDAYYWYLFPLLVGERLFLGAKEDDFILDGYSIRRFKDVTKAEIKDDKCLKINIAEGVVACLVTPEIDITNWKTALTSLQNDGINIIIEKESLQEADTEFAIGRVIKVLKNKVLFKAFDADGIWDDDLLEIPFPQITSITFGSRYVDVFSKYLPPIS